MFVVAHFMHEQERAAAVALMADAEQTDSFLMGDVDENTIALLRENGLIVQVLEDTPPEPVDELIASVRNTTAPRAAIDSATVDPSLVTDVFTVQLSGPLLAIWRDALNNIGVQLLEAIGPYRYTARFEPDLAGTVRNLSFVRKVRPYSSTIALPTLIEEMAAPPPSGSVPQMLTYDIRLHEASDVDTVLPWLLEHNVAISGSSGRKIRVHLFESSEALRDISVLPGVSAVEEYVPPELFNDRARVLVGIDTFSSPATTQIAESGRGQTVAVADTGIDENHPDFQNRIIGISALGRTNDYSDPNGHGTHVAGSVLGDGNASGGDIKGTAPEAQLFFQSVMDRFGRLGGLPLDLNDLFNEAYLNGARIHNNSWGAATNSRYTFNSIETDEFVDQHRDMLIVISAGNEGHSHHPKHTAKGFVDWLSVGAPATSKNALTVGASRSDRTQGGYSSLSWGQAWPGDFSDPPIASEKISGDPQALAAFSSRGPCDDRRIKPDVVAPGTDIVSTKSSRAPLSNFWGAFPGHNARYAYNGGTSMAAPIVAGCAALVRQHYEDRQTHQPSAALVKATLINGTRWLTAQDSTADFGASPNFHQGFGCIHMPWTLPNVAEPSLGLEFVDTWNDPGLQLVVTGNRVRYRIKSGNARELRFCLAWTDAPARALQNNLNLFVEFESTRQKWLGNADLPMRFNIPDPENNVEIIRIENPPAGDFIVQVTAQNLLSTSGQDFALVVTGDLQSGLSPY